MFQKTQFANNKDRGSKGLLFKNVELKSAYQPPPSVYNQSVIKNYYKASHQLQAIVNNQDHFLPSLPDKKTIPK